MGMEEMRTPRAPFPGLALNNLLMKSLLFSFFSLLYSWRQRLQGQNIAGARAPEFCLRTASQEGPRHTLSLPGRQLPPRRALCCQAAVISSYFLLLGKKV